LLGAVTLVMAFVVFVPMILDNEPRQQRSTPSIVIPPKDNPPPLPAPSARAPAGNVAGPNVSAQAAAPSPKAPISASGEVIPPEPAKTPPPAPNSPKLEGFAVQVGAFRDEDRLKQARAKLEASRVPHYIERVDGSGGAITRLRAGPFPTREAAEAARATMGDGQVVSLP
jgi:DedD protein